MRSRHRVAYASMHRSTCMPAFAASTAAATSPWTRRSSPVGSCQVVMTVEAWRASGVQRSAGCGGHESTEHGADSRRGYSKWRSAGRTAARVRELETWRVGELETWGGGEFDSPMHEFVNSSISSGCLVPNGADRQWREAADNSPLRTQTDATAVRSRCGCTPDGCQDESVAPVGDIRDGARWL